MLELKDLDDRLSRTGASARPGRAGRRPCSTRSASTGRTPTSRTSCTSSGSRSQLGGEAEGGTITFQTSGKTAEADGATTVLEAGEEAGVGMPYGCRMGICHTCTLTLVKGAVKDLRNGEEFNQPNEQVQTCVTAAMGDCTFDI